MNGELLSVRDQTEPEAAAPFLKQIDRDYEGQRNDGGLDLWQCYMSCWFRYVPVVASSLGLCSSGRESWM